MDKTHIFENLKQAEDRVLQGERHLATQRKVIDDLRRDGHDITDALDLIETFESLQKEHVQDRDRLRRELDQALKET